ncbi:MAG: DUF3575 domain-containing protein [Saprospiraceae bacterium]
MKKLLFSLVCVVAFSFAASSQMAVKVNPLGLLFGSANAGLEYAFSETLSGEIGANYSNVKATLGNTTDASFTGIGGYAMVRWYFKNKGPLEGWYLAPNFSIGSTSATSDGGEDGSISSTKLGVLAGYQWVFGDDGGFLLDLGLGMAQYSVSSEGAVSGINIDGLLPDIRLAIGYAF